jgi:sulfur relay (sulfurtransferase) complex TusBCD TusD component (DsrE family)
VPWKILLSENMICMIKKSDQPVEKEVVMPKTVTLYLSTSPYSYENTLTSARIAESALNKGHTVNLIASADGVYCFLTKQKAKGILNAEEEFARLIQKGLKVYL